VTSITVMSGREHFQAKQLPFTGREDPAHGSEKPPFTINVR